MTTELLWDQSTPERAWDMLGGMVEYDQEKQTGPARPQYTPLSLDVPVCLSHQSMAYCNSCLSLSWGIQQWEPCWCFWSSGSRQGPCAHLSLTSPLGPGIVVFRTPRSSRGQHKSSLVCAAATGACRSGPVPCVFRDKKEPRPLADPKKLFGSHKDSIYVHPLSLWWRIGCRAKFIRGTSKDQESLKELFTILGHRVYPNQKHPEIPTYVNQNG